MLISELDVGDPVPLQSQIARITDNEKIGINISNRGRRTLIIEKTGTSLALELSTNLHEVSQCPIVHPRLGAFNKEKALARAFFGLCENSRRFADSSVLTHLGSVD